MGTANIGAWLLRQRTSTRLGFLLQLSSRLVGSLLGLVWNRLLFGAMGSSLYGVFLSFQRAAALGGLGDLGMGGAVALQTGQHLGVGKERELREFLAGARTAFLLMALFVAIGFLLFSPRLPQWLHFQDVAGAGSLGMLFAVGGIGALLLVMSSYFNNLNYACGNILWPILPVFLVGQLSLLAHWQLAKKQFPLWAQYLPYVGGSMILLFVTWTFVRMSHPSLASWRPLRFDRHLFWSLIERSFWAYLCSLGSVIYTTVDYLLINGGIDSAQVTRYHLNYRLCDLSLSIVVTAGFVSMPKITQWLASGVAAERERVIREAARLSQFQTALGCGAALAYLALNDSFIRVWLGSASASVFAPWSWQTAFALNVAVAAGADAGIQIAGRCGSSGLRIAGSAIGLTGLLNLGLSFIAMKAGFIAGIALATVMAQTVLSLILSAYMCRCLQISWKRWALKTCLLPLCITALAAAIRHELPLRSLADWALLVTAYTILFLVAVACLGIRTQHLREEFQTIRGVFKA